MKSAHQLLARAATAKERCRNTLEMGVPGTPPFVGRLLHNCRYRRERNFTMRSTHPVRHAALALVFAAMSAGAAFSAPAGPAPATTIPAAPSTTPSTTTMTPAAGATMPNSNPYTPQHGTTPQGTPALDTANPYQPRSSLTPVQPCPTGTACATPPSSTSPCVPSATTACPN